MASDTRRRFAPDTNGIISNDLRRKRQAQDMISINPSRLGRHHSNLEYSQGSAVGQLPRREKPVGPESFTKWEVSSVSKMGDLVRNVRIRHAALQHLQDRIAERQVCNVETVARQLFRCFSDLNSVLNYLVYLCYCHFNNDGEPDTNNSERITFPYDKSICISTANNERDTSNTFKENIARLIFKPEKTATKNYKRRKVLKSTKPQEDILKILLEVQPVNVVDEKGINTDHNDPLQDDDSGAYCLSLLRFLPEYRMDDLIGLANEDKDGGVTAKDSHYLRNKSRSRISAAKVLSIEIPNLRQLIEEDDDNKEMDFVPKPLLYEVTKLINFVANTTKKILCIVCEREKEFVDKLFDERRVQFKKDSLVVDDEDIAWEKYEEASSMVDI
ncbi:hypothetical protein HOLleu_36435 [Holothuria leucospilota]|uniref:Uncharacterized protein n=1 Tax=Holothuria leucospilota TaxID=206669 RepID=A0A9Q1BFN7_HOLLE|nr:hypothetical protein HOLleu_36435 [Holothuria leucospilota]